VNKEDESELMETGKSAKSGNLESDKNSFAIVVFICRFGNI